MSGLPPLPLLHALSRVLSCDDCCPSCRAVAAEALGLTPLHHCEHCGFPKLTGEPCPCEQHIGQPPNPASEKYKAMSG